MIEFNTIWIISLALFIFTFLANIFCANFLFSPIDNDKKVFTRIFPFEVINNLKTGLEFYKIILFIFGGLCFSPLFFLINNKGYYETLSNLTYFITGSFGLAGIVYIFLHFFNPSNVKTHLILVTIFTALVLISGVLNFSLSCILFTSDNEHLVNFIFGILSIVCALFEIISVFAFKLKNWANLENENGVLKRPHFFPLAAFEWSTLLMLVVEEVSFFLVVLKY